MDAAEPSSTAPLVAVAASGGRDSTALLHAVCRQARDHGLQVLALHVHHGLNPQADRWADHLRRQCARWRRQGWPLQLQICRLQTRPAAGQSIEAWARRERYAALAAMARAAGADTVLLAHHRRDQAETVLLQALRGGGAAGLAAMPVASRRDGICWLRPWLHQPSQAIAAYIRRWQLGHIDDDSNADTRYDRNRLRHAVWPALVEAFPQAEASLGRAARQAQFAAALIDEVAGADLRGMGVLNGPARGGQIGQDQQGTADDGLGLPVVLWLELSLVRRRFALRAWLQRRLPAGPSESLIDRLLTDLPSRQVGRWPDGQGGELRLYRGQLQRALADEVPAASGRPGPAPRRPVWPDLLNPLTALDPPNASGCVARTIQNELNLSCPGRYPAPGWGGSFEVCLVSSGGVARQLLRAVTLTPRRGGEQFQSQPRSLPRSLKKQFQAAAVPAWARSGPLLRAAPEQGGGLIFVPGLGLDARLWAPPDTPQLGLAWHPDRAADPAATAPPDRPPTDPGGHGCGRLGD